MVHPYGPLKEPTSFEKVCLLKRRRGAVIHYLKSLTGCRGQAQHGELGYGPNGKKSAANPDKCKALEGVHTHQVYWLLLKHPCTTSALSFQML